MHIFLIKGTATVIEHEANSAAQLVVRRNNGRTFNNYGPLQIA